MKKIVLLSLLVSLFLLFTGCDDDESKVDTPNWIRGSWQPKAPTNPDDYAIYRYEEHDILLAYVINGNEEAFGSEIVDEDFYTELESSESNFNYKLDGLGIAETIKIKKVDASTCVRISIRNGQETLNDTLIRR